MLLFYYCVVEVKEFEFKFETRWIGCGGVNVPDEAGQKAVAAALAEKVSQNAKCFSSDMIVIIESYVIAEVYSCIP